MSKAVISSAPEGGDPELSQGWPLVLASPEAWDLATIALHVEGIGLGAQQSFKDQKYCWASV